MSLLPNWKTIAKKSWSFRLGVIAFILTGLEAVIQVFGDDWIPPYVPRWVRLLIIAVVMGAAPIARLIAQKKMANDAS